MLLEQETETLYLEKHVVQERTNLCERDYKHMIKSQQEERGILRKRRQLESLREELRQRIQGIQVAQNRKQEGMHELDESLYPEQTPRSVQQSPATPSQKTVVFQNSQEVDQQLKREIQEEQQSMEQKLRQCKRK